MLLVNVTKPSLVNAASPSFALVSSEQPEEEEAVRLSASQQGCRKYAKATVCEDAWKGGIGIWHQMNGVTP